MTESVTLQPVGSWTALDRAFTLGSTVGSWLTFGALPIYGETTTLEDRVSASLESNLEMWEHPLESLGRAGEVIASVPLAVGGGAAKAVAEEAGKSLWPWVVGGALLLAVGGAVAWKVAR